MVEVMGKSKIRSSKKLLPCPQGICQIKLDRLLAIGCKTWLKTATIAVLLSLAGCISPPSTQQPESPLSPSPVTQNSPVESSSRLPESTANRQLLEESWGIYRERFIQEDGRVIDYEASDRSTSEGQAYAMLRAVLINDRKTFDLTLNWAQNNLRRRSAKGDFQDQLWSWKWGSLEGGNWGQIDSNFASDADIDAITALILAARRWNRSEYLDLARLKLQDLWQFSTIAVPEGQRYLLPGPKEAFVPSASTIYLNPSYFAPYAFRLFAQVDPEHDWLSLVESSYQALEKSSQVSQVGLPSDWIALDTQTGQFKPLPTSSKIESVYSFDAYRVWWRVAWDAAWFQSPEALRYLRTATRNLQQRWDSSGRLPARINLQGRPLVNYEATSQYAMLYSAFSVIAPDTAKQLLAEKLLPQYNQGVWDDQSAYYTQNLVWLALLPPETINPRLLQPQ
ncbi:glycosyl hydrolase family 8 [Lyngbya aestuarii]|uniref:glycosyl hydrolase family 8 n=1 Tax=Lyngbya aestuarii TaxID=118322 RepID=UPI00403D9E27